MNYFIPPSLYFKLLSANRKNGVKISDDYKHLDWINDEELLKAEVIGSRNNKGIHIDHIELIHSNTYKLTAKGKTLLFRINWGIILFIFGIIGGVVFT